MSREQGVVPVEQAGRLRFSLGALTMVIDPNQGARITEFSYHGTNCLLEPSSVAGTPNANNFGATFWPSPQAAWGWPPVESIDRGRYDWQIDDDGSLVLTSRPGILLNAACIDVTKRFRAVPERSCLDVSYQMTNRGEREVQLAPWQITRVAKGGLTLFGLGPAGIERDELNVQELDAMGVYTYDVAQVAREGQKTFADALGWVAHAGGGQLLVHTFPDVPPGAAAPGEAELELYADPSHTYIEIEPQGRLLTIRPGETSPAWTVSWRLQPIGNGTRVDPRDPGFLELVNRAIQP
jgi:hypothetical protein